MQGAPVDIGGYYQPDEAKAAAAMRPSKTLNAVLEQLPLQVRQRGRWAAARRHTVRYGAASRNRLFRKAFPGFDNNSMPMRICDSVSFCDRCH